MRKLFFLVFCCFFMFVAFGQNDSLKARQQYEEGIREYEVKCTEDEKKASLDVQNKNVFYIIFAAPQMEVFLPVNELKQLLMQHKIQFGGVYVPSDIPLHYTGNCYVYYINKATEEKFGKALLEKLEAKSHELFVINNPEKVFTYRDLIFQRSSEDVKLDNERDKAITKAFLENLKLNKIFKKQKDASSYFASTIDASYIINTDGSISNLTISAELDTDYIEFEQKIIKSLKKVFKSLRAVSKTYYGFPVKSEGYVSIKLP